jgi:hypothetical protein
MWLMRIKLVDNGLSATLVYKLVPVCGLRKLVRKGKRTDVYAGRLCIF